MTFSKLRELATLHSIRINAQRHQLPVCHSHWQLLTVVTPESTPAVGIKTFIE